MRNFIIILLLAAILGPLSAISAVHAQNKQVVELKTVVIDAGHGGHDPGATNGRISEKNIHLSVAKRPRYLNRKN